MVELALKSSAMHSVYPCFGSPDPGPFRPFSNHFFGRQLVRHVQ
ncbi:hypothetical protein M5D96_009325, partial [Drosophila gunungcola]